MKWLETIALHFGTCCHSKSFNNIGLFNKKMLIHKTVWIYKKKDIYYCIKSLLKTFHTGTKTLSINVDINTNIKKNSFFGEGLKKTGLGIQSFFVGGREIGLFFCRGGLGVIWMYRNTDIWTGSEWGILIIVKGGRSMNSNFADYF